MDQGRPMIDSQEHVDAIYRASAIVTRNANAMRECHTVFDDLNDWNGDEDARRQHENETMAATFAESAADYLADLQTERDALFVALKALVEEQQPLGIWRQTYQDALALIVKTEDSQEQQHRHPTAVTTQPQEPPRNNCNSHR